MGLTARLVEKYIQEKAIRGAVLYFGTPTETLFAEAFGVADHRAGRAMTLDCVFDMASVTKALCVATLLARAVELGKILPDAPFADYLPGYRGKSAYSATVCDLATHYSGLDPDRPYDALMFQGPEKLYDAFRELRVIRRPRAEYCYTCGNYILLGMILEHVYGAPLEEIARREIFAPLGMECSSWGLPKEEVLPDVVHAFLTTNHSRVPAAFFPPDLRILAERDDLPSDETAKTVLPHRIGNAGLFSCAEDLAKFARFMLRKPFPERVWRILAENLAPEGMRERSAGWDMEPTGVFSSHAIHHTGWSGQSLWIDPAEQVFGLVLTNRCGEHENGKACRLDLIRAVREEIGKPWIG